MNFAPLISVIEGFNYQVATAPGLLLFVQNNSNSDC